MPNDCWTNLPVKSLQASKDFFNAIGLPCKDGPGGLNCVLQIEGKGTIVMFQTAHFQAFAAGMNVIDATTNAEMVISIGAVDPAEVDELAGQVEGAGGRMISQPTSMGWMYGCVFADPDGHRWNVIYMDWEKMPKPEAVRS